MKIEVSSEVVATTTQCQKGFPCLSQPVETLCKVERSVYDNVRNDMVIFVHCRKASPPCSYQMAFGDGFICSCPTRRAIYNRYKL